MFNNVKLGIAPIGWTNDDMPQLGGELTFEQMVSEAALAGFQGTEVGGKFPTDPAVLNKALGTGAASDCIPVVLELPVLDPLRGERKGIYRAAGLPRGCRCKPHQRMRADPLPVRGGVLDVR